MKNILIVGQGIAGSVLAFELFHQKHNVVVIDNAHHDSSSKVAAGILNPITGKRFTVTGNYDALFGEAVAFYHELENIFGQTFFELTPIIRVFQNQEERDQWMKHEQDADQHYVEQLNAPQMFAPHIDDPFGSILITSSGFCHTGRLLNAFKIFFQEKSILKTEQFSYTQLKVERDHVSHNGVKYDKVIFCEGYQVRNNPWFSWIPFQPVKGEILKVAMDDKGVPHAIVNKGKWITPGGLSEWTAGSNYDVKRIDCVPTEEGKQEIVNALENMLNRSLQVLSHQAGVRPATTDQQPVIGWHPELSRVGIFNGFGSKGFLMVPSCAKQFVRALNDSDSVSSDFAVGRFWKT